MAKVCPIMSAGVMATMKGVGVVRCKGYDCAWWVPSGRSMPGGRCAAAVLALAVDDMAAGVFVKAPEGIGIYEQEAAKQKPVTPLST